MEEREVPIIRELSRSMINRIAAGEVVERPANVVKELVENAIDAGATKIDVEVEGSGVQFMKVIDNGCGIPVDQLELALTPHATSKISQPDDLINIATLGFRGEALASIAEISHLTLTSRAIGASDGGRIRTEGEIRKPVELCGRNVGTTVEVRDLFFNAPVRRKFLKSPGAEYGQIKDAITRVAIPHPEIAFSVKHDGALDIDLPKANDSLDRIRALFGDRTANSLVRVDHKSTQADVVISGYVGRPELYRGSTSWQFLFVNGRYFRDKQLAAALKAAYQGVLKQGMYPVVFLNVATPRDFVDVNVHPMKLEVRFSEGFPMYAGMLHSVRDTLFGSAVNLEKRVSAETIAQAAGVAVPEKDDASQDASPRPEEPTPREIRFVPDVNPCDPQTAVSSELVEERRNNLDDWFATSKAPHASAHSDSNDPAPAPAVPASTPDSLGDSASLKAANDAFAAAAWDEARSRSNPIHIPPYHGGTPEFKKFPNLDGSYSERRPRDAYPRPTVPSAPTATANPAPIPRDPVPTTLAPERDEPIAALSFDERRARVMANSGDREALAKRVVAATSDGRPVVQFCNRYLVLEAPDGIALVDQHALHERILYEKFKAEYDGGRIQVQNLVVPALIELSPSEYALTADNVEFFAKLGISIALAPPSSVEVQGYPALFHDASPGDVFLSAFRVLNENRLESANMSDILEGALAQMACKAAIKAGDKLGVDEIAELVARAEMEAFAHHCPHGRPSTVVLSIEELDKFFIRD